ncbi:MAG: DUF1778 domain-containing protein [Acidobacteria bacterium]|nr:DUF1778 domain-containing protein [Acidobacteriota bacterium]
MATKTARAELRLSEQERLHIEAGAAAAGTTLSAFIIAAAMEQADAAIARSTVTEVPSDYFDELLGAIDHAAPAPALAAAARRVRRSGRLATR